MINENLLKVNIKLLEITFIYRKIDKNTEIIKYQLTILDVSWTPIHRCAWYTWFLQKKIKFLKILLWT